jgi:hypothetical protein
VEGLREWAPLLLAHRWRQKLQQWLLEGGWLR